MCTNIRTGMDTSMPMTSVLPSAHLHSAQPLVLLHLRRHSAPCLQGMQHASLRACQGAHRHGRAYHRAYCSMLQLGTVCSPKLSAASLVCIAEVTAQGCAILQSSPSALIRNAWLHVHGT